MPLQNRVDPYGKLHAVAARGAWMGNRGVLHDESRRVVAAWRTRRWIACVLEFKGRRREVFAPRRYSELFFLDEATALAAGHRPCAECRRARYEEFRAAWAAGRRGAARRTLPGADAMDRVLHAERVDRRRGKRTYAARLSALPDGTMVEHAGRPHLLWARRLLPWRFEGYGAPSRVAPGTRVRVLTPRSIVAAIRAGFVPQVHAEPVGSFSFGSRASRKRRSEIRKNET
jgi:hypothetical protein